MDLTKKEDVEHIVRRAIEEDIGNGDVTTQSLVPPEAKLSGRFIAKARGIIAGWDVAQQTFACLDKSVRLQPIVLDGACASPNQVIAAIRGPAQAILTGERTALNFLQRMSGIATLTRKFVDAVRGTSTVILDTRKTIPGLRMLDKAAVRIGGGENHRFCLSDMVLIKENHIAAAGGITEAVRRARSTKLAGLPRRIRGLQIEVEVKNLAELQEALALTVDRILLDNMSLAELRQAVVMANHRIPLEASGNITLENVADVAATGVNFISIGQLTHSAKALDISLLVE